MSTVLDPPLTTGLVDAREIVGAAARTELWTLTDTQLAAEIGDALALKAQAEAVLLTRLAEADTRELARTRGATSMTGWLRGSPPGPRRSSPAHAPGPSPPRALPGHRDRPGPGQGAHVPGRGHHRRHQRPDP